MTGILAEDGAQVVFIDTPGIFVGAKRQLEQAMVKAAWTGAEEGECILFVVDASRKKLGQTHAVFGRFGQIEVVNAEVVSAKQGRHGRQRSPNDAVCAAE